MKAVFCESHHKFELMVETVSGPLTVITLNEQANGKHHLARENPEAYCHAGPLEACQLCPSSVTANPLPENPLE